MRKNSMRRFLIAAIIFGVASFCYGELTADEKDNARHLYNACDLSGDAYEPLAEAATLFPTSAINDVYLALRNQRRSQKLTYTAASLTVGASIPTAQCSQISGNAKNELRTDVVGCVINDLIPDAIAKNDLSIVSINRLIDDDLSPEFTALCQTAKTLIKQSNTELQAFDDTLTYSDPLGGIIDPNNPTQFGPHGNFHDSSDALFTAMEFIDDGVDFMLRAYGDTGNIQPIGDSSDNDFLFYFQNMNKALEAVLRIVFLGTHIGAIQENIDVEDDDNDRSLRVIRLSNIFPASITENIVQASNRVTRIWDYNQDIGGMNGSAISLIARCLRTTLTTSRYGSIWDWEFLKIE